MQESQEYDVNAQDGTRLWYQTLGQGPVTLVLCDGVGCAGYIWKYVIPHFKASFRILHAQYRGHGRSAVPKDINTMSVEQLAEDLSLIINSAAATGPLVLLGHSMGVQVALEYYSRHPGRVSALVLINGPFEHALRHVHSTKLFARALPFVRFAIKRWESQVDAYWQPWLDSELSYLIALIFEVNPLLTKRRDFRPYFKELGAIDPNAFFTAVAHAEKHSARHVLPMIKVPILVVASERDRFTPFSVMKELVELLPQAETLVLQGASHIGPLERPELLNTRMETFLKGANLQLWCAKDSPAGNQVHQSNSDNIDLAPLG